MATHLRGDGLGVRRYPDLNQCALLWQGVGVGGVRRYQECKGQAPVIQALSGRRAQQAKRDSSVGDMEVLTTNTDGRVLAALSQIGDKFVSRHR